MKKLLVTPEGTFETELTTAEIAQREQDAIQSELNRIAEQNRIANELANKQSALTKLSALGLTEAEIKALIGE
jgi:pyrroloquinoline quinone (PQQ) biosynthesis protein C